MERTHSVALMLLIVGAFAQINIQAQVADAGPDQWVCGDSTYLQGNGPMVGQTGTWSVFAGSGVFVNANVYSTQVNGLTTGDNELVWTITDGVTTTTDTVAIVAYDPSVTPIWTMGDTTITGMGPAFQVPLYANPYTYPQFCNWSIVAGSGSIDQPYAYTAYVTGLSAGSNIFRWMCNNGPCGISLTHLNIVIVYITTGILESKTEAPFYFDNSTGALVVTSSEPISELRVVDLGGRQVDPGSIPDGIYIAAVRIGQERYTQRFVVAR